MIASHNVPFIVPAVPILYRICCAVSLPRWTPSTAQSAAWQFCLRVATLPVQRVTANPLFVQCQLDFLGPLMRVPSTSYVRSQSIYRYAGRTSPVRYGTVGEKGKQFNHVNLLLIASPPIEKARRPPVWRHLLLAKGSYN